MKQLKNSLFPQPGRQVLLSVKRRQKSCSINKSCFSKDNLRSVGNLLGIFRLILTFMKKYYIIRYPSSHKKTKRRKVPSSILKDDLNGKINTAVTSISGLRLLNTGNPTEITAIYMYFIERSSTLFSFLYTFFLKIFREFFWKGRRMLKLIGISYR